MTVNKSIHYSLLRAALVVVYVLLTLRLVLVFLFVPRSGLAQLIYSATDLLLFPMPGLLDGTYDFAQIGFDGRALLAFGIYFMLYLLAVRIIKAIAQSDLHTRLFALTQTLVGLCLSIWAFRLLFELMHFERGLAPLMDGIWRISDFLYRPAMDYRLGEFTFHASTILITLVWVLSYLLLILVQTRKWKFQLQALVPAEITIRALVKAIWPQERMEMLWRRVKRNWKQLATKYKFLDFQLIRHHVQRKMSSLAAVES